MADQILTTQEIENLFQSLTATITGLDPNSGVRIDWPTDGAPGWAITDDIAFLRVTPSSDRYIQQRDSTFADSGDGVNVNVTASYTRVHAVDWIIYGPNAPDNAETLRNGLYQQTTHDTLAASNVYMILDVGAPARIPELFNGQWWERADISARFNEQVIRYTQTPYLETAQITVESDDGKAEVIDP